MNFLNKIAVFLIISTSFCNAQDNIWSLQKCIETALENNIEIKIRNLEVKRIQKSQNSVWNQLLPAISFTGNQIYNFGSTIDPSTNGRVSSNIQNDNFFLNANMNLIDFANFATAQKGKIDIEKAKVQLEIIENEYKLQLIESYFQALFSQELLKIQREQLSNANFNLERIAKEVAIGSKPKSDFYDIQFAFSQEEQRILETEQLFEIQKIQLFQLINFVALDVKTIVLEPYFSISKELEVAFGNKNPKIKLAELDFKISLKNIQIQKSKNLPTLSTFYGFSTFYYKPLNQSASNVDNFNSQIQNNKNQQIGLQLSVPIFNGFRNHKTTVAAKIESQKTKFVIEQEKQKLDNQVALENQKQNNFKQLQNKLIETLSFAKASFITTEAKFVSGKIDAFIFSSVKNLVLSTEYDLLKNNLKMQFTDLKIYLLRFDK